MTTAHQATLLFLAQQHGIEAYAHGEPYSGRWMHGKKTEAVVVTRKEDVETLTVLFREAAAKPARFGFQWDSLGRDFIVY